MIELPPGLLLVDDDPTGLAELSSLMERRYGRDYRILSETSAHAALRQMEALRDGGGKVALVMADQWMPEMTGIAFLTHAQDLHPAAKRLLIVDGMNPADLPPILQATTLGRIDHHLHKPWTPADDRLHPTVTELLAEWTRSHQPRFEAVKVVGSPSDPRSHELRDLLGRNNIPHGFYAAGSASARTLLRDLGVSEERLPVVSVTGGNTFVQPTTTELAAGFGLRTSAGPELCDVAIIGAGPAGLAAAVYAGSEGLDTVIVEREAIGGQAGMSSMIRNYLGFPRGVSGTELAQRARSQAWHFGVEFVHVQTASALRVEGPERVVTLSGGSELRARAVLLATGVWYRRLAVPSVDRLHGVGVFYGSATTEAKALAGQQVYVVGGANSAGQAALHLSRYAARVSLVVRRESLAATMSSYLIDELQRARNVDVRFNAEISGALGERRLEGLIVTDARTGAKEELPAAALFIMIGAEPQTEWLAGVVQRDGRGSILTGSDVGGESGSAPGWPLDRPPRAFETNVPGVFAAGDVRHGSVKRVASAVGEASVTISLIHQYLSLG